MNRLIAALLAATLSLPAAAQTPSAPVPARYQPQPDTLIRHPDWMKTAVLYQINTRQFTPEGTLHAAQAQLPRLKALGSPCCG